MNHIERQSRNRLMARLFPTTTFGEALDHIRRYRKLTLKQLGTNVGLSAGYLSMLQTGRSRPTKANVLVLSKALKVKATDLTSFRWGV